VYFGRRARQCEGFVRRVHEIHVERRDGRNVASHVAWRWISKHVQAEVANEECEQQCSYARFDARVSVAARGYI
jgi:hypothetical protein